MAFGLQAAGKEQYFLLETPTNQQPNLHNQFGESNLGIIESENDGAQQCRGERERVIRDALVCKSEPKT
jgi:hypothetical protein